jgi:hypothetical protein
VVRSTERARAAALLAVVVGTTGCLTGHLFDRARRREYVGTVREAWLDDDRLVIGFGARVTDDDGHMLRRAPRWAVVSLAEIARTPVPAVEHLASWSRRGRRVAVWDGSGPPPPPPRLLVGPGADGVLRLADETSDEAGALAESALTVVRTEPWVYAVAPLTVVLDVAITPPLAAMAPAVLLFGD